MPIMHGWDLIMRHAVNTLTRSERPKCCSSFVSTALDVGEVPITPASGISTCAMVLVSARPLSQVLRWPRFSLPCVCVYGPSLIRGSLRRAPPCAKFVICGRPSVKQRSLGKNRFLLEDTPVIEHIGEYTHVRTCPKGTVQ